MSTSLTKPSTKSRPWLVRISWFFGVPCDRAEKWDEGSCECKEMCGVSNEYNTGKSVAKQEFANATQQEENAPKPNAASCCLGRKSAS